MLAHHAQVPGSNLSRLVASLAFMALVAVICCPARADLAQALEGSITEKGKIELYLALSCANADRPSALLFLVSG